MAAKKRTRQSLSRAVTKGAVRILAARLVDEVMDVLVERLTSGVGSSKETSTKK